MFWLFAFCISLTTALLPPLIRRMVHFLPGLKLQQSYDWLPVVAGCLFAGSYFVPNIHISSETMTFQQHFVGGGLYTACLFVYFRKLLGWRLTWFASLLMLFAWVSAFGVANELLEFALTKLNIAHIELGDVDWDLLANSLGALVGYCALLLAKLDKNT